MTERLWQYAESITELARQAVLLERMLKDGVRKWGGGHTKAVLGSTLESLVSDTLAAANLDGDNEWLDEKRRWARRKLRDHGFFVDHKDQPFDSAGLKDAQ